MAGVGGFVIIKGITPAYDLLPLSGSSVPYDTPPTFSWSAEHSGKYQVRVSDTPSFTVLRMTSKTTDAYWQTDTQWTPDPAKWKRVADTYQTIYWMVVSKDPIGRTSSSISSSLDITR